MPLTKDDNMWIEALDNETGSLNIVTSRVLRVLSAHGVLSKKNTTITEEELWPEVELATREAMKGDNAESVAVLAARGILRRELEQARR